MVKKSQFLRYGKEIKYCQRPERINEGLEKTSQLFQRFKRPKRTPKEIKGIMITLNQAAANLPHFIRTAVTTGRRDRIKDKKPNKA